MGASFFKALCRSIGAEFKMEYRALGRTNLKVSYLSFGCATLGGVYGDIDEQEAIDSVHKAIEVNIFVEIPTYSYFTKVRYLFYLLQ